MYWRSIGDASSCFHEFVCGLVAYYAFVTGDPDEGGGVKGQFSTSLWKFWAMTSLVDEEDLTIGASPADNRDSGPGTSLTDVRGIGVGKYLEGSRFGR